MTSPLPYRFREDSVRDYELALASIVANWPGPVTFTPKDKSPITFSNRLRDANKSFRQHQWASTVINYPVFNDISLNIVVREKDDGTVIAGSWDATKDPSPPSNDGTPLISSTPSSEPLVLRTLDEKRLVCLLASRRLLATPLLVGGINLSEAEYLANNYDISLELTADQLHLLI